MKKIHVVIMVMALIGAGIAGAFILLQPAWDERKPEGPVNDKSVNEITVNGKVKLPAPKYDSGTSVEQALLNRRSVREYKDEPMTLTEVSQILWAAQGISDARTGFRTAPSAGALYPLEVYVIIVNVEGAAKGVYKYAPHEHELVKVRDGNVGDEMAAAAVGQTWVGEGGIIIVFCAVYERTTQKYGDRGIRYVHMEVGHAAQNVYLQAVSLNLGTAVVGAFEDEKVRKILNMSDEEDPLYIVPVGKI
ncbi:MAG: SagB/ThcOx family dehydrogenase [Euryarchaeota archaeon]|nr:SagB/ThcOx family dehydrogenase [Euryarchaeota archaeon]MBU4454590.1 SagB/ThcOx family dehydrogenase [Euryarchaeota archaeon]MCG2737308.1 SagB/ThcOx family dehydrogenase [Candidatus Methanoperedenaceae archaeon]MDP3105055.1 SagB/ThcOx family dehydrogenase [Candidatus Methanoperedens sp.]